MRIKLKDLGSFGNGAQRPKCDGAVPVYGGNGILGWSNQSNYPAGTIIIGRVGAYCGSVFLALERCWVSDNAIAFCPNDQCNSLFLAYYLKLINLNSFHIGSSQPLITQEIIGNIEIDLPCCEVQTSIAKTLSSIDSKIDNNNAICADLEGMAKLLYDYWFVQFDFPDENGKPYKSSGGKMARNEELKREIPEGWEVIRLGDCITSDRGISYNSTTLEGNGVPMINLASFNVDSTYKASGLKTYSGAYGKEQVLRPYDLVMCNTQQTAIDPAKDIIGRTLLVPDIFDGDIVSSHHVTSIHVSDDALKYYLHAESKTSWFHKYVAGFASGTNILGLDFKGVLNYKMPIPPKEIMSKFANISHSSEARKNEIIRENADLVSLRDFLLPMLMNGQVKVKGV